MSPPDVRRVLVAGAEDVDRACRLAFNHRMGPLQTADLGRKTGRGYHAHP
jgi:3-hydroxyacyl-CoA dehydrogenase